MELTLKKVDHALQQGVLPTHEALWEMFLRDFQSTFTNTTKTQNAHQELLELCMKPGFLDDYISSFEHLRHLAGWGTDDAGTIMLFKKGLTQGLHHAVLKKTTLHPTTLHRWMEAMCRQYELWAQIKASLGGSFGKPQGITPVESQKWHSALGGGNSGKKHPWSGVRKEDRMDLDATQINTLAAEEKIKLQKEGRCFTCKKLGHISRVCPNKLNKKDAVTSTQNGKTAARNIKPENNNTKGPKEAMAEQIKAMSTEEWNVLLNNLVLQGF